MPGVSQEEFFEQIKSALADRGEPVDLPDDVEISRAISPHDDLVEVFMARVEQAGMNAYRVDNEQQVSDKIAEIIEEAGGKSAIVTDEKIPGREQFMNELQQKGIQLKDMSDADAAFDADFGITAVNSAIAETGSICLTSGQDRRRMASLAVPNHIAVVRADLIIPDLLEWIADQSKDLPANAVLVSAPSKTADIEMILVHGVHGPKEEHIIIVG
ncbi:MAG: lactate utilization protein [Planctomycetota bacterium]|nr:MAG: lactate utilization protein [Planctomycetota bacterium]